MLHRWNLLNKRGIKNCIEKMETCTALRWHDYGHILRYGDNSENNIQNTDTINKLDSKIHINNTTKVNLVTVNEVYQNNEKANFTTSRINCEFLS
jgi:hypothetical protein